MLSDMFKRSIHISRLITIGSVCVLLGTILSLKISIFGSVEWLVLSICLIGISFTRTTGLKIITIIVGTTLLGLYRGGVEVNERSEIKKYIGEVVYMEAHVTDDPTISEDGDTRFIATTKVINGEKETTELWVSIPQSHQTLPDIKRSDTVEMRGVVNEGFGTYSAAMYRAELIKIVRIPYSDVARDVRDSFASSVRSTVDQPESDLGNGFLLGTKTRLPEKLDQELRLLGLTHIVVASGYNLTILVRLARRLLSRVSRFAALAGSVSLVIAFAHVTGWSPSMMRAAVITLFSLATWYVGRKTNPITLLSIVAAFTVLIKPSYAWGDIGWLLSFLSFSGVIILAPMLHLYFWGDEKKGTIKQILVETFSAQIVTAPLIIFIFGQYSPLALTANLLVLPFIPLAMLLTFIAGVSGLVISGNLSTVVAWPAQMLLRYMVQIVDWLAQIPFAKKEITINITELFLSYLVIIMVMVFLYKRTHHKLSNYNIVE